jgi:hypothetical protein
MALESTGFPALLVDLLTMKGYRWYPQYTVYEEYHEFNQENYRAKVVIFDRRDRSINELYTFFGCGVTVEMAVHDAAFVAITRLRGELTGLEDTGFRYFPYVPTRDKTTYYPAVCTPFMARRYDPQYLVH